MKITVLKMDNVRRFQSTTAPQDCKSCGASAINKFSLPSSSGTKFPTFPKTNAMSCQFNIPITTPISDLIDKARKAITNNKGSFEGDTSSGNFSIPTPLGKISGIYTVEGNTIAFDILDKPAFLGCSRIESELKKYLGVPV